MGIDYFIATPTRWIFFFNNQRRIVIVNDKKMGQFTAIDKFWETNRWIESMCIQKKKPPASVHSTISSPTRCTKWLRQFNRNRRNDFSRNSSQFYTCKRNKYKHLGHTRCVPTAKPATNMHVSEASAFTCVKRVGTPTYPIPA